MMLYLGIYLVFGAIYCVITRKYLYNELMHKFHPLLILVILDVFWLPFICYGMFVDIKLKVEEFTMFSITKMEKSLQKDKRFSFKEGVFVQETKHCLSCKTTSDLEEFELDITDDEDEDHVYYSLDYYLCHKCEDEDVNIVEVLEKDKGKFKRSI
ncbi:hypothetical protein COF68_05355 [Bacillus toyonensis]|uniref:hypothetical protein n=1 Tax=Bacillus toyonensis TaxID=155322 RepID=UPI000BFC59EA|nr:hypothetical protein [Bacillus toyonensis]PHE64270.1 hypothetical protein COF68_05355 [Bacillus toyonensis]